MESSILSEVDETSILRTGLPRRYACPLNWLPASRLLPRAAGWSAATLCFDPKPTVGRFTDDRLRIRLRGSERLSGARKAMFEDMRSCRDRGSSACRAYLL